MNMQIAYIDTKNQFYCFTCAVKVITKNNSRVISAVVNDKNYAVCIICNKEIGYDAD